MITANESSTCLTKKTYWLVEVQFDFGSSKERRKVRYHVCNTIYNDIVRNYENRAGTCSNCHIQCLHKDLIVRQNLHLF